ncbi:hypothetical protein GUJ93_ZPchr0008g11533 [Zizania palustris]|uniref:Uncharacterized protein n=1 Tax=Zizania palustris TaxID=103762 RepID=A0A8J5RJK8_ZIZPA|nr:hypothetical protein GUJ93_ZPchr0008g11533 [Zizania palustris]
MDTATVFRVFDLAGIPVDATATTPNTRASPPIAALWRSASCAVAWPPSAMHRGPASICHAPWFGLHLPCTVVRPPSVVRRLPGCSTLALSAARRAPKVSTASRARLLQLERKGRGEQRRLIVQEK